MLKLPAGSGYPNTDGRYLEDWDRRRSFSETETEAIVYAEKLTNDIHGVSDKDFAHIRGSFNDSQIIELTMTVCFYNHFVRFIEALNLPVEQWVLDDRGSKDARHRGVPGPQSPDLAGLR